MTTDLAAFLLACVEEDEAIARTTATAVRPRVDELGRGYLDGGSSGRIDLEPIQRSPVGPVWLRHVERWQAARVLSECRAKRRIVEHVELDHATKHPGDPYVLRLLALPYADRPGYRPEWAL